MHAADHLLMDAKQAILQEQHRKFTILQEQGDTQETLRQFQVTLSCACDLLNHSLDVLQRIVADQQAARSETSAP
ncbi:MAG: hypothetical protein ACREJU_20650 [Nitrospiraceae bacterium]